MKTIQLSRGKVALVSDHDFERVSRLKWFATPKTGQSWYAYATIGRVSGKNVNVEMHRFILAAKPGEMVDHRNHDGLDNTRPNLRLCTPTLNAANARYKNKHGYRGVYLNRKNWRARIYVGGRHIGLGTFATKEGAALAYNEAAVEHFGEFATLNEVPA